MARRGMDTTVAMKKAKVYRGTAARPSRAPTITKSVLGHRARSVVPRRTCHWRTGVFSSPLAKPRP